MPPVRWDIRRFHSGRGFCGPRPRPWPRWRSFSMRLKGGDMEIIDPLGGAEAPAPPSVPPVAEEHPPLPAVPPVQPAGFLRRAVAFLIDTFILQLLYFIIMIVGFLAIRLSMGETFSFAQEASLVPVIAPFVAAWFCLFLGYFTFFHAYGG
ncbi:MAG: hypothetical protein EPO39_15015, partial [Candidatus Manganitrophaceae bacterium]